MDTVSLDSVMVWPTDDVKIRLDVSRYSKSVLKSVELHIFF